VPKSLKEALMEQLGALQERGLAPSEVPDAEEPDEPAFNSYGSTGSTALATRPRAAKPRLRPDAGRRTPRPGAGRRDQFDRPGGGDEFDDSDRGGAKGKRPAKASTRFRRAEPEMEMAAAPQGAPAPAVSRTDLLRERAEQRRRDDADRQEVVDALQGYRAGEAVDEEAITAFFAQLTEEVGALPPLRVVLHALRAAQTDQPAKVGDQVRVYYRTSRARRAQ